MFSSWKEVSLLLFISYLSCPHIYTFPSLSCIRDNAEPSLFCSPRPTHNAASFRMELKKISLISFSTLSSRWFFYCHTCMKRKGEHPAREQPENLAVACLFLLLAILIQRIIRNLLISGERERTNENIWLRSEDNIPGQTSALHCWNCLWSNE